MTPRGFRVGRMMARGLKRRWGNEPVTDESNSAGNRRGIKMWGE